MIKSELAKQLYSRDTSFGEVRRQINLPWAQAARISYRNVTMRLGRAMITGAGVVLGIAFLTSVWTAKVAQEGIDAFAAQSARAITGEEAALAPGAEEAEMAERAAAARQTWLVVMSLLVSAVGITNSMLMSVTERFREIATLKCLGALDGFIMLMFVLEAAFLGAGGGVVGALLGTLLAFARMVVPYGTLATASFPLGQIILAITVSAALGVVLAAVASVYPSLKAARLAPMEAMRIQ